MKLFHEYVCMAYIYCIYSCKLLKYSQIKTVLSTSVYRCINKLLGDGKYNATDDESLKWQNNDMITFTPVFVNMNVSVAAVLNKKGCRQE